MGRAHTAQGAGQGLGLGMVDGWAMVGATHPDREAAGAGKGAADQGRLPLTRTQEAGLRGPRAKSTSKARYPPGTLGNGPR